MNEPRVCCSSFILHRSSFGSPRYDVRLMLRLIWLAIVAVLVTIPIASATLFIAIFRSTSPLIDRLIRRWASALVWAARIDLRTENLETIDLDKRYVLVSNHHSYL